MSHLIKKIQNYAFRHQLWKKGDKILVAVSGGPDSVFLLNFFAKIAPKYDLSIHMVHVNYGLRGQDSEKDEQLVQKTAKSLGFPLSIHYPKKSANSSEAYLREIRYSYFENLRNKLKFDSIAIAHTMDDQAETVLMKIIRGAGIKGLSAIQAKNGNIIRPLLETSRKDIMAYLKDNKLKSRLDKSNLDQKYLRNKIRHSLLPLLEQEFNPEIKKRLSVLAETTSEILEYINDEIDRRFAFQKRKDNQIVFNKRDFLAIPQNLRKAALRRAIEALNPDLINVESGHIQEIQKAIDSTKNKSQELQFNGLKLKRNGANITLTLTKQ